MCGLGFCVLDLGFRVWARVGIEDVGLAVGAPAVHRLLTLNPKPT